MSEITDTINKCCSSMNLYANEAVVNVVDGKGKLLLYNLSEKPVCNYKNKKLSNLVTFDEKFISHLNTTSESEECNNKSKSRSRWDNNTIHKLYDQLEIDSNPQLSEEDKINLKALIRNNKYCAHMSIRRR